MPAKRCSICGLNFPIDSEYDICPVCEDEDGLDRLANASPDDPSDLRRTVNRALFEREYGPADVI